jgi:D-alanine transaminase
MKTVGLTANILANQEAMEKGAKEALFVRDGVLLEGSHSNFMAVMGDCLVTAPATNTILHGITRQLLLTLCGDLGIEARQAPIFVSERMKIKEAFITGTTTEITPVVSIDGIPVGDGVPGPVTKRLQQAFNTRVRPR